MYLYELLGGSCGDDCSGGCGGASGTGGQRARQHACGGPHHHTRRRGWGLSLLLHGEGVRRGRRLLNGGVGDGGGCGRQLLGSTPALLALHRGIHYHFLDIITTGNHHNPFRRNYKYQSYEDYIWLHYGYIVVYKNSHRSSYKASYL